jgi:hypothetical protein
MNAPAMVPATLRGKAAVAEVQDLLTQLVAEDETIAEITAKCPDKAETIETKTTPIFVITVGELLEVFQRRREAILLKLENKGIKVAPDPAPVSAADVQLARDQQQSDTPAVIRSTLFDSERPCTPAVIRSTLFDSERP